MAVAIPKWIEDAPCAREDHTLFMASDYYTASPALMVCGACPFRKQCLTWVNPARSWYDGVAGGVLWLDGKLQRRRRDDPDWVVIVGWRDAVDYVLSVGAKLPA